VRLATVPKQSQVKKIKKKNYPWFVMTLWRAAALRRRAPGGGEEAKSDMCMHLIRYMDSPNANFDLSAFRYVIFDRLSSAEHFVTVLCHQATCTESAHALSEKRCDETWFSDCSNRHGDRSKKHRIADWHLRGQSSYIHQTSHLSSSVSVDLIQSPTACLGDSHERG